MFIAMGDWENEHVLFLFLFWGQTAFLKEGSNFWHKADLLARLMLQNSLCVFCIIVNVLTPCNCKMGKKTAITVVSL